MEKEKQVKNEQKKISYIQFLDMKKNIINDLNNVFGL